MSDGTSTDTHAQLNLGVHGGNAIFPSAGDDVSLEDDTTQNGSENSGDADINGGHSACNYLQAVTIEQQHSGSGPQVIQASLNSSTVDAEVDGDSDLDMDGYLVAGGDCLVQVRLRHFLL